MTSAWKHFSRPGALVLCAFFLMGAEDDCLTTTSSDMDMPPTQNNSTSGGADLSDFAPYTLQDNRTFRSQTEEEVGGFGVKLCGRFTANGDDAASRTLVLEDPQEVGTTGALAGCDGSGSEAVNILRYFRDLDSWSGRPGMDTCARAIDNPGGFACGQYSANWDNGRHELLLKVKAENDSGAPPAYLRVDVIDQGNAIEYRVVCPPTELGDGTWDVTCDGAPNTPVIE